MEWGKSLPPVLLLHGTADTCALVSNATQFSRALEEAGAQVSCLSMPPQHLRYASTVLGLGPMLFRDRLPVESPHGFTSGEIARVGIALAA